jgi:hypothetical protein
VTPARSTITNGREKQSRRWSAKSAIWRWITPPTSLARLQQPERREVIRTKFEVELNMFQNGAIRVVEVPDNELNGKLEHDLDMIFFYGQNDVQLVPKRCSVSAGDVVRFHGTRYLIDTTGFSKLTNGGDLSSDRRKRISQLFGKEKHNDKKQSKNTTPGNRSGDDSPWSHPGRK